jgi:uncharacterized protein YbjT (DUF2867 family)
MRAGVLVTGANGFVGRAVVKRLWDGGWPVFGLVSQVPPDAAYIPVPLEGGLPKGAVPTLDALVLVGGPSPTTIGAAADMRHVEAIRRLLAWARYQDVGRVVYISVLGAGPDGDHPLKRTKGEAEAHVRDSGLRWTILRPSLIFGPGSPLFDRLERWARRPFVPVRRTTALVQPIYVGDVAEAVARVLSHAGSVGRIFDMPGPHAITARELFYQMGADTVWWRRRLFYVPPEWERRIRWPWTPSEWAYWEHETFSRASEWITELGILPRSLSMVYAAYVAMDTEPATTP